MTLIEVSVTIHSILFHPRHTQKKTVFVLFMLIVTSFHHENGDAFGFLYDSAYLLDFAQ